jgi:predicted nucleic acid binding AN1-type Zn finger protein
MAAHTAMLQHLGIDPGPEDALRLREELRKTTLSCAHCHCPVACSAWVMDSNHGNPPWCRAASAFVVLTSAFTSLEKLGAH